MIVPSRSRMTNLRSTRSGARHAQPLGVEREVGELAAELLEPRPDARPAIRLAEDGEVSAAPRSTELPSGRPERPGPLVQGVDGRALHHERVHELLGLVRLV